MHDPIEKLLARFTLIGEQRMRDLPIYNHALKVETVAFQTLDAGKSIGVLITPWFMNVILLYATQPQEHITPGNKVTHELPTGEHQFMVGEDEELGRYDFITLSSPMVRYKTQQLAREAAYKGLNKLLNPQPELEPAVTEQPIHFVTNAPTDPGRRAFLRGRSRAEQTTGKTS